MNLAWPKRWRMELGWRSETQFSLQLHPSTIGRTSGSAQNIAGEKSERFIDFKLADSCHKPGEIIDLCFRDNVTSRRIQIPLFFPGEESPL
ncbi:MAG: hypothetical protein N3G20_05545 [Verrucomicrobiae bacterium]|nr:hypothetical protein [Verrucomicrobiae bacterium]